MKIGKVFKKHSQKAKSYAERVISRDFSVIEDDENSWDIIKDIVAKAGENAAAEAKAAGLPSIYIKNNQLIKEDQQGSKIIIRIGRPNGKEFYIPYPPSTVLHARHK